MGQAEQVVEQEELEEEPGKPQRMNHYRLPVASPYFFVVAVHGATAVAFRQATVVVARRAAVVVVQQVAVVAAVVVQLLRRLLHGPPAGQHQMNQYRPPG